MNETKNAIFYSKKLFFTNIFTFILIEKHAALYSNIPGVLKKVNTYFNVLDFFNLFHRAIMPTLSFFLRCDRLLKFSLILGIKNFTVSTVAENSRESNNI